MPEQGHLGLAKLPFDLRLLPAVEELDAALVLIDDNCSVDDNFSVDVDCSTNIFIYFFGIFIK